MQGDHRVDEHFWVDDTLYDSCLRKCLSLKDECGKCAKLFDVFERFIIIGNGSYINAYQIQLEYGKQYKLKEIPYKCRESCSPESALIFIYGYSSCPYFDVVSKHFIIDAESIRKERFKHKSTITEDYDLINDGLDGEASAYWGLLD